MSSAIDLHPKAFYTRHVFYWQCRLNNMTALLAGPFANAELAEKAAEYVSPVCVHYRPETRRASFGVMRCLAPGPNPGIYNEILPPELMGEILIDTGWREGDATN
jgi:hypothetical protein